MSVLAAPVAYADSVGTTGYEVSRIAGLLVSVLYIVDYLTVITIGLAFLYFFWGLIEYIRKESSSGELEKAKNRMFFGVLAIFVIFSMWGIVFFLRWVFFGGPIDNTGIQGFRLPQGTPESPRAPLNNPKRDDHIIIGEPDDEDHLRGAE